MQLTKHRDTFTLQMTADELVFLVNNLGSDPVDTISQEKITETLKELTKFREFAISYDQYIAEQIAIAEAR